MVNIPIYRANKIDSDEWVEGYLTQWFTDASRYCIENFKLYSSNTINIDPSTLAIHFPNMIDKNGKKIFASLSEDGVGGDIDDTQDEPFVFIFKDYRVGISPAEDIKIDFDYFIDFDMCEVIGINKANK